MKEKYKNNKKVLIPIVSILLVLVIVGASFAFYKANVNKKEYKINLRKHHTI